MTKILTPPQSAPVMEIARELLPPGMELVVADPGKPEFYDVGQGRLFVLKKLSQISSAITVGWFTPLGYSCPRPWMIIERKPLLAPTVLVAKEKRLVIRFWTITWLHV